MKIQLAILAILAIASTSLKLNGEYHQGFVYNNTESLLNGLVAQQSQFQEQIAVLDKDLNQTVTNVLNTDDIGSKIQILEKGILVQEEDIFVASTKIIPKLVLKDQCESINETQKQSLIQKCEKTILQLQDLLTKLDQLPQQDARIIELKANCNHQIYYLKTIQTVLRDNCTTTAVLSPTVFQSNIYATNWITGDQTINDIVTQYILRSQQYDNITNCPLATPYYNGAQCINCVDPTPIFNMKTMQCTACPSGSYLDAQQKACKIQLPNATNPAYFNRTVGPIPVSRPTDVLCPPNTPFYNGNSCISCPELFDFSTRQCTSCPAGSSYNSTLRTCLSPNITNPLSANKVIGNLTQSQGIPCPIEKPFFNGTGCISCAQYFDLKTLQCAICPPGSYYDSTFHACVGYKPNATNLAAGQDYIGVPPTVSPNDILCPDNAPYFVNGTCIDCTDPNPIFDFTSKSCINCGNTASYDPTNKKCVSLKPTASNLGPNSNYTGAPPPISPNDILCPEATPYFRNGTCIACPPSNPIFDFNTGNCVSCNSSSYYDIQTRRCILKPANVTNFTAGNSYIGQKPAQTPYDVPCPAEIPYFTGSQCINCTSDYPYFDLANKICVSCPEGQIYVIASRSCQNIQPTGSNPIGITRSVGPLQISNTAPCPEVTPFFTNAQGCINCTDPTPIFDANTQTCMHCTGGYYNATDRLCYIYNATNPGSQTTIGTVPQNTTYAVYCPIKTPYFNQQTKTCFNCPLDHPIYNVSSQLCVSCPAGSGFNFTTHQCQSLPANATNPSGANTAIGQVPQPGPNDVLCNSLTPYYVGNGSCINCNLTNPFFDVATSQCVACPTGTSYSTATHSCNKQYASNLKRSNWVSPSPFKDYVQTEQAIQSGQKQQCPDPTPYFNGSACINCTMNPYTYFDVSTSRCIGCSPNTQFNPDTHKCELIPPQSKTNYSAGQPNMISADGTPKQYYKQQLQASPLPECPASTPYYNGIKCIQCSSPYPYFDMFLKDCARCPAGQTPDATTGQCLNLSGSTTYSPDLASMTANIFRHESTVENHQYRHRID